MSLFTKKETVVLKKTEQQRDAFIEKLEKAHVDYDVSEDRVSVFSDKMNFYIRLKADDLKKVS